MFDTEYLDALVAYLGAPGEDGLETAYELGRRALEGGLSMLDLVGTHLRARSALLRERGIGQLSDMDAFLSESLVSFEITQRGYVESHRSATEARQRVELLRGLSDAYLAIAGTPSLEDRLHQVCVQAQEFLDAEDARLEFGRRAPTDGDDATPGLDEMVAELSGSGGRLILRARPGNTWTDVDRTTLERLAVLISAPIDDARQLDFTQRLERVGALIAQAADRQAILVRLLQDGVAGIGAEDAALWLVDGETPQLFSAADTGAEPAAGSERAGLLAAVAASGETVFLGTSEAIAAHLGTTYVGADEAWAAVPINAGDRRLGAIGLWYHERQPFDGVQRSFIVQLANRVGAVLERGRAYERERLARREAELASKRFQALQELATDLSRAATQRRVALVLLRRSTRWSGALGGFVATAAGGRPFEVLAGSGSFATSSPDADGVTDVLDDVLRELHGRHATRSTDELSSDLRGRLEDHGVRSLAVYPIIAGRRSIGVMVLGWAEPFAAAVLDELLRAQVAMAGPALARAERYDLEHDIADTLQRSILALPDVELPGVRWSAHYRAGSAGLAGGDWYDLYALDEHRMAITVGDIVGRGVQAAAAMGQLRSAARAMARLVDDPAALLTAVDEFTSSTGQGRYSSMAYLVLDTLTGELEFSIAGHPPPIIRSPDGTTALLDTGGAPLVGIECKRESTRLHIEPGTLLVVYTDGLIERRTEPVDVGIQRLVEAVGSARIDVDPDTFCADLATQLLRPDGATDDVAIVTVQLTG